MLFRSVGIARILTLGSRVLLMDEPFGALDYQTRIFMQELLLKLWVEFKPTVFFITHDVSEAIFISDRVLVMSKRPGHIIDEIAIDLPHREDPIARRADPKVGGYVTRLMEQLGIGEPERASA